VAVDIQCQDILDTGFSVEAEATSCDEWFQKMKVWKHFFK